jgi:hypothetical protein
MAIEAAGWLVVDDSNDTTSFFGDHDELDRGKVKAIPGYDRT